MLGPQSEESVFCPKIHVFYTLHGKKGMSHMTPSYKLRFDNTIFNGQIVSEGKRRQKASLTLYSIFQAMSHHTLQCSTIDLTTIVLVHTAKYGPKESNQIGNV